MSSGVGFYHPRPLVVLIRPLAVVGSARIRPLTQVLRPSTGNPPVRRVADAEGRAGLWFRGGFHNIPTAAPASFPIAAPMLL